MSVSVYVCLFVCMYVCMQDITSVINSALYLRLSHFNSGYTYVCAEAKHRWHCQCVNVEAQVALSVCECGSTGGTVSV